MTSKQRAICALENMKGDDLYRAQRAFGNFTQKEMQEQHGQSGKTRAEILQSYIDHNRACDEALEWVKSKAD